MTDNPVVEFQWIKFYSSESKKSVTFFSVSPFIQCIGYYIIVIETFHFFFLLQTFYTNPLRDKVSESSEYVLLKG